MLRIWLDEMPEENIIHDVEKQFKQIKIQGTDLDKLIIETIEGGKYNDTESFIDRFGFKLHLSEISTGCKAALCVANCKDLIIDIIECGNNARDAIIKLCKNGSIYMVDNGASIKFDDNIKNIDCIIGNYRFRTIQRLNKYISSEYPFEPDLEMEGIEYVSIQ